jgi:inner membrane protein involved in colicin E2 resistance
MPDNENKVKKCVMETLQSNGPMKALEIREAVGKKCKVSGPTVVKAYNELLGNGDIERDKGEDRRNWIYFLPEDRGRYLKAMAEISPLESIVLTEGKKLIGELMTIPKDYADFHASDNRNIELWNRCIYYRRLVKELEIERNKEIDFDLRGIDKMNMSGKLGLFSQYILRVIRTIGTDKVSRKNRG